MLIESISHVSISKQDAAAVCNYVTACLCWAHTLMTAPVLAFVASSPLHLEAFR